MQTREQGTIVYARINEDRGVAVIEIGFEFAGSSQAFQRCFRSFDEAQQFGAAAADLFDTTCLDGLIGQHAYALRCWPTFNEPIEGFETMTGKRLTITGWCRRNGIGAKSPLAKRHADLLRERDSHDRRSQQIAAHLETFSDGYTDWETP